MERHLNKAYLLTLLISSKLLFTSKAAESLPVSLEHGATNVAESLGTSEELENRSPAPEIRPDLLFEVLPGKAARLFPYHPEEQKCKNSYEEDGKTSVHRYIFNTPKNLRPNEKASELNDEDHHQINVNGTIYPGELEEKIIIDDEIYENHSLSQKGFVVVKRFSELGTGEDNLYCIRKEAFFQLTGKAYVHKIFDLNFLNLPQKSPKDPKENIKVEFRELTDNLKNIPIANSSNKGTGAKGQKIGILPLNYLPEEPKGLALWAVPFFFVDDPKTVHWMGKSIIYKSSKGRGESEPYKPIQDPNTSVDASHEGSPDDKTPEKPKIPTTESPDSYMAQIKKKVLDKTYAPKGVTLSKVRRPNGSLVQFPVRKGAGTSVCGSYHYGAAPNNIDAFASPTTACLFTAVLQEWKKTECGDLKDKDGNIIQHAGERGCRISYGDISHTSIMYFKGADWPHRAHTVGTCIDIRPPRKSNFKDAGLVWGSWGKSGKKRVRNYAEDYDQKAAIKMAKLFKKWGATPVLFNDTDACGTQHWRNHDDHFHICFPETSANKAKCIDQFKLDPATCPELAAPISEKGDSKWQY